MKAVGEEVPLSRQREGGRERRKRSGTEFTGAARTQGPGPQVERARGGRSGGVMSLIEVNASRAAP